MFFLGLVLAFVVWVFAASKHDNNGQSEWLTLIWCFLLALSFWGYEYYEFTHPSTKEFVDSLLDNGIDRSQQSVPYTLPMIKTFQHWNDQIRYLSNFPGTLGVVFGIIGGIFARSWWKRNN